MQNTALKESLNITKQIDIIRFIPAGTIVLFLLIHLFCSLASAQTFRHKSSDFKFYGLSGRPQRVEEYKITPPHKGQPFRTKYLNQIITLNKDRKILDSTHFVFEGNESYYKKTIYGYDAKGRKILIEGYESAKTTAEDLLLPDLKETGISLPNPHLKETLVSRITYKYNEKGGLVDFISYQPLRKSIYKIHYDYDYQKHEVKGVIFIDGVKISDSRSSRNKKGWIYESTDYNEAKPYYRLIEYYDKKQRLISYVVYKLKLAPNRDDIIETISNQTKISDDDQTRQAIYYDDSGNLEWKTIALSKNNLELSSIRYKYHPDNKNPDQSKWLFNFETKIEYKFDKEGTWIKAVKSERNSSDGVFLEQYAVERVITYF